MIRRNSPSLLDLTNDTNPNYMPQYNLSMERALDQLPHKEGLFRLSDWYQKYNVELFPLSQQDTITPTALMTDTAFKSYLATKSWRKLAG